MSWILFLWELAGWSLLALSIWQLRKELPHPPVRRCEDCRYSAAVPDSVVDGFQPDERHCILGRGIDYSMYNSSHDAYEVVSVVWGNSSCDRYAPREKRRGGTDA